MRQFKIATKGVCVFVYVCQGMCVYKVEGGEVEGVGGGVWGVWGGLFVLNTDLSFLPPKRGMTKDVLWKR